MKSDLDEDLKNSDRHFSKYFSRFFLTTERSKGVPFFRAVRVEKRGRKVTPPQGGEASIHGREVIQFPLGCSPPFVGFLDASCPKRQQNWTKLGRKHVLIQAEGWHWSGLPTTTRGPIYQV